MEDKNMKKRMKTILTKINKLVGGNAIPSKQRSAKPSKQRSAKLSKHSKPAFTIIELLMVIAIISVLATIVTTASVATLRSSRAKRRDAMRVSLEAAIATYHAQDANGELPGAIENLAAYLAEHEKVLDIVDSVCTALGEEDTKHLTALMRKSTAVVNNCISKEEP